MGNWIMNNDKSTKIILCIIISVFFTIILETNNFVNDKAPLLVTYKVKWILFTQLLHAYIVQNYPKVPIRGVSVKTIHCAMA